jgi:2-polyprenyl-3-methyl-5-hydroxy-6-metoxy-1,4-benzoquinol methylase
MIHAVNWRTFWEHKANTNSILEQVGRISNQSNISEKSIIDSVNHLIELGDFHASYSVLDICCGNGYFTSRIRPYCAHIIGIDFSTNLITEARKNFPDIEFFEVDIVQHSLPEFLTQKKFDRITLCFSFQYFESIESGKQVIQHLISLLKPDGKIIITDIPDQSKFFNYYHSIPKILRLIRQKLTNKNDMGKFWSEDELNRIVNNMGMKGEKHKQPKHLPYANYRMDYVIVFP